MVDLLEPGPREQVREALSQVQMLYARETRGGGAPEGGGGGSATGGGPSGAAAAEPQPPPREPPPGLWTPPGSS